MNAHPVKYGISSKLLAEQERSCPSSRMSILTTIHDDEDAEEAGDKHIQTY